jgi:hypothetical protein
MTQYISILVLMLALFGAGEFSDTVSEQTNKGATREVTTDGKTPLNKGGRKRSNFTLAIPSPTPEP